MSQKSEEGATSDRGDHVVLSEIQPICGDLESTCGYMRPEVAAVAEDDHRCYRYCCDVCGSRVGVVVADSGSPTERQIVSLAHIHETELHPDDGVSITEVGFRCTDWPEHGYMRRVEKRSIKGVTVPKSDYLYRCDNCSSVRIVVPRAAEATPSKTG